MTRPFRRFWSRVEVRVGEPVPPEEVTADGLAARIATLGGWDPPPSNTPDDHPTGETAESADQRR
jgi:hypothetical protein